MFQKGLSPCPLISVFIPSFSIFISLWPLDWVTSKQTTDIDVFQGVQETPAVHAVQGAC